MFGEAGVRAVLAATREMSGDQFSDELLTALRSASGRNTFEDDVCIVTIQSAQPAGPVTPV
jgi:serine phosphatase RsbU (regulator of sigma subunit)